MTMHMKSTGASVKHVNNYRCKVMRIAFSLLFIQIHLAGIQGQSYVGSRCIIANGRRGECVSLSQCPNAQLRGNDQGTCSYRGNNPLVCCLPNEAFTFNNNNNNNNVPRYTEESRENIAENNNDNVDNIYYVTYDQSNRRQTPSWWQQTNRPFGSTTVTPAPWPPRQTTTTRRPRPSGTRPTTRPSYNEGSVWGFGDGNQPSSSRPVANRPTTGRPFTSRPIDNRPTTSTPYRPPYRPTIQQKRSISEQKCIEYSHLVSTTVAALPLLIHAEPVLVSMPKCDYNSVPLIVGGTQTSPGEFPHMAAVGYRFNGKIDWDCGGSLISDLFVMTAAHCTTTSKGPPYMVRLGELDLKRDNDGASPRDFRVAEIIRHPDNKPPARYNDIALLRLVQSATFNKFIRPACLYSKDTFEVSKAMATGWGKIDFAEEPSDILLKVSLDIINSTLCKERYDSERSSDKLRDGIVPTMMCAGDLKGERDTCQGDSGGPIQITSRDNQCIFHVIGITSFGKFCAAENTPGVYTRVSSFVPWIESVVWP